MKVLKPFPKITNLKMPFFFPHLTIAHLYGNDRHEFDRLMFCGTPDNLETFWSEVEARADPRLIDHPMAKRVNWKRKAVPIFLHGDDVPVVRVGKPGTASLSNCSWQPLLTRGRSLYIKRLIFGIFRQNLALGTEARYWHMIAWSLTSLRPNNCVRSFSPSLVLAAPAAFPKPSAVKIKFGFVVIDSKVVGDFAASCVSPCSWKLCRHFCPDKDNCPPHKYLVNPSKSSNRNPGKAHAARLEALGIAAPPTKPWSEWREMSELRKKNKNDQ